MSYYEVNLDGPRKYTKIGGGRRQRVSRDSVQKAMQSGGGAMYDFNPRDPNYKAKVLMWPNMWSPSDIGKPDCGTPTYTVVEDTPVEAIISTAVATPSAPPLPLRQPPLESPSPPKQPSPSPPKQPVPEIIVQKAMTNLMNLLSTDNSTKGIIKEIRGSKKDMNRLVKLNEFSRRDPFTIKETDYDPNKPDEYSQLPLEIANRMDQARRTEKLSPGSLYKLGMDTDNPCLTNAIFAAINKYYLDPLTQQTFKQRMEPAKKFYQQIVNLIKIQTKIDRKSVYPLVKIIDNLSGTTDGTPEKVAAELCSPPGNKEVAYLGLLSALLQVNIVVLEYVRGRKKIFGQVVPTAPGMGPAPAAAIPKYGDIVNCRFGFNNPNNSFIVLVKTSPNKGKYYYEPVLRKVDIQAIGIIQRKNIGKDDLPSKIVFSKDSALMSVINTIIKNNCAMKGKTGPNVLKMVDPQIQLGGADSDTDDDAEYEEVGVEEYMDDETDDEDMTGGFDPQVMASISTIMGGGGMIDGRPIDPKYASKTLTVPNMWSFSDTGKPDCGTPSYEVIDAEGGGRKSKRKTRRKSRRKSVKRRKSKKKRK